MNNELWKYVQQLKKGNLQVADLNGCVSTQTTFIMKDLFNPSNPKRNVLSKFDSGQSQW